MCAAGVGGIPLIRDRHPSPIDDLQRGGQDSREFYSFPLVSFIIFATWQLASVPQIDSPYTGLLSYYQPALNIPLILALCRNSICMRNEQTIIMNLLTFHSIRNYLKLTTWILLQQAKNCFNVNYIYIVDKRYNKCICVVLSYIGLYILYSPKMIAIKQ